MIKTLDDAVGQLMDTVDELGLTERTIFLFTSDNGGLHVLEFPGTPATHNTPYRAGKGYLYEGGLREPLLIRWPGVVEPGQTIDTPVVLTDLVPTLLEAAGINVANTVGPLDGVSLLPVFRGKSLAPRSLFWHFPNYTNQGGRPAGAVRSGDWKLVENFEDNSVELYNLASDASEQQDVAEHETEVVQRLRGELAAWRTRVGAQMPVPNPAFNADLHRTLYINQDSSRLVADKTAVLTEPKWKAWRTVMNQAVAGSKPRVTPAQGDIRLLARDAKVHGEKLRYEPESHKNVLGYWTNPQEIQQGCGQRSGGAEVDVEVGNQTLKFTVVETGHFQHMILRTIGTVELAAGPQTLSVKPRTKPGVAVMDIRRVVLRPL
jgi:arylsulfatase A